MFSPPFVPGGRVSIYPLSATLHGEAVNMPTEKEIFFKKTFGEAKCARLQNADGRKGFVSGI